MRILNLKFANINSLYGKWEIDFEDKAFQSAGIFAITGPTGSGKTTILDAICLALYDHTPRVSNPTKGDFKNNEVMNWNLKRKTVAIRPVGNKKRTRAGTLMLRKVSPYQTFAYIDIALMAVLLTSWLRTKLKNKNKSLQPSGWVLISSHVLCSCLKEILRPF